MTTLTPELLAKILARGDLTDQERAYFENPAAACGTPMGPEGRSRVNLLIREATEEA